ncbi:MAG: rhamnogalacturonan acetylesterase [Bacteroidetes bacterium]|nr:MAG: rhamnogalacturonan acetylesterase [Bacteroidota bacterium]
MKQVTFVIFFLALACSLQAQQTSFKFDFGSGKVAPGYIQITSDLKFSYQTGYGFDQNSIVESKDRGGDPLTSDFITSDKPFYFSVKLPDGNYDLKVIIGDKLENTSATIRAECRRLMVEKVTSMKGKTTTVNFTVHVKDSLIRDATGNVVKKIRLKDREVGYLHWDNLLTLEFNGANPKICAVEITPNKTAPTIFLAGNSTVVDQDREPWAAWGQMIPSFFEGKKIAVANYAESGEALNSFISARRLEKILSLMKAGDYLFIEFGHNDQKQKGEGVGPFTSYKRDLKFFISEVRKKGGIPVLVTSMHRRNFDSTGHIVNTLGDYPEAVRQTAKEENVALIDLNAMSKILYEAWGPEKSIKAFVHYPANTFPGQKTELKDNTHFNTYGAWQIAKCIMKGIKDAKLNIAKYLRKDIPPFDPGKPDPVEKWNWPLSQMVTSSKPDGN